MIEEDLLKFYEAHKDEFIEIKIYGIVHHIKLEDLVNLIRLKNKEPPCDQ